MVVAPNEKKTPLEEIRKALGGPPEKLMGALSSLNAWSDEVLAAMVECVEKPQESGEKGKKKDTKGRITLANLRDEGIKRFLTDHMSQLGPEGAVKVVRELETRIGDEKREEEETRVYSHLLAHLCSAGTNVMGSEKLRGAVKETLATTVIGLRRRGVKDASYSLARVLVYILMAERDYVEGREEREGEQWWKKEVVEKEKKLRKNAFFAALTTLIESEKEKAEWSKVDLEEAEEGAIAGSEGVLTARWILVDTVVCHAPSLAVRCASTVFEQLMRIVVRAHVERAELSSLFSRLSSMADLPRSTWTIVVREAIACIQRTFESCIESRERLVVEGQTVTIAEEGRGRKHRVGCGCSARVAQIIRGLAAAPKTSIDEKTIELMEKSLLLILSSMDTTEGEPLREGMELMKWLIEERERHPSSGKREWPSEGVQLLRGIKAMLAKERTGETHTSLLSLSRCILAHYGHRLDYPARIFVDVGHVATRVLIGETSAEEMAAMKPSGAAKETDKLAKSLLKWANAVKEAEEIEEKEVELLSSWSQSLLTATTAHGLNTVVLQALVSMGRERREELLPRVWNGKTAVRKMIDDCLSLLLVSSTPDETFERNTDEHLTSVVSAPAAAVDAQLARVACLFLLNCTPYLTSKISPADLATWERLQAMDVHCASLVLERTKPEAIQSLFASLPTHIEAFTPIAVEIKVEPEEEPAKEEEKEEESEEKGVDKVKKRKRVEAVVDPLKTASLQQLTRCLRLASLALSERAAVRAEDTAATLAAAAACLAVAAPAAVRAAAEAAAAAFYEMATRCLEVYGESSAQSGILAIALAAAATRQPPSNDYERSRAELLQYARMLAAAARHCKQGLLKDQVSIYAQLLARLLQAAAAHAERVHGGKRGEDSGPSAVKRRRDEQRTLHAAAKAANAVNDERQFGKVMPFVLSECLLPLRTAAPSVQYPAVLLSHAIDRYGRSFLATCLPPTQRLAYTRMFPTFKEMNRKVI